MEYENKVAIVTGAAVGIGRATARQLAAGGAKVMIVDIKEDALIELKSELQNSGFVAEYEVCDVSCEARVREVVEKTTNLFGKIDILINNAGIYFGEGEFTSQNSDTWKKLIDINILGTMYFTHAVLPQMKENKYGRIVNLGSVAAVYGIAYMISYSMTKGAIHAFTKALSKEAAPYGVTVNTVAPGNIHEDMGSNPEMSFLGRSGTPKECAEVICYLASDRASYVTGQCYQVDGGRKVM